MPIVYDVVRPEVLTGFVREVPSPANWDLNRFLPDKQFQDIEAAWDTVTRVNRAATFRAYDAETPIGRRDSFKREKVELPPLGQKTVVGEYERLKLEQLRQGGDSVAPMVDRIYDDAEINTRATLARMEVARGDVLADGKFTLRDENGLTIEADFGLPADHKVAPAVPWSQVGSATVLQDLLAWKRKYRATTGEDPGVALTSDEVLAYMLQNAEIRALVASTLGTPSIINQDQLNTVLAAYRLPAIVLNDTKIEVGDVATRVTPATAFMFLPTNPTQLGFTAWGITAEALELAGGQNPAIAFEDTPGLVGVVLKDGDPVRVWTKVAAVGMPVLTDPRYLMVAEVA